MRKAPKTGAFFIGLDCRIFSTLKHLEMFNQKFTPFLYLRQKYDQAICCNWESD